MSTNVVYTIKKARFELDGKPYPFNYVLLHAELNGIPEAVVTIPPDLAYQSGKTLEVAAPTLEDIKNLMTELYGLLDREVTGVLEVFLGSEEHTRYLALYGWLLADVSIGTANTTTGFIITCKLRHPAYNLVRHGYFAGNLDVPLDYCAFTSEVGDLVQAADVVVDELCKAANDAPREQPELEMEVPHASSYSEVTDMVKRLVNKYWERKPSDYLTYDADFYKCGYTKKPLENIVSGVTFCDMKAARDAAMLSSLTPDANTSLWDAIVSAVELWGCVIIPDYDGKLRITPATPWGQDDSYNWSFAPEEIASLTLPTYNANPLLGINVLGGPDGTDLTASSYTNEAPSEDTTVSEIVYVPTGNLQALSGRLAQIGPPPWANLIMSFASSFREANLDGESTEESSDPPAGSKEDLKDFVYKCKWAFAAYMFQSSYKSSYEASLTIPLHVSDLYISPGRMVVIPSVNLNGYITVVDHEINLESCHAMTKIKMSHCRPEGGYPGIAEEGDKNPLYT